MFVVKKNVSGRNKKMHTHKKILHTYPHFIPHTITYPYIKKYRYVYVLIYLYAALYIYPTTKNI